MKLLIVIVNYRSAELTIQCLRSLADEIEAIGDCRVTVVENASGEDAILRDGILGSDWESWCQLMSLDSNGGFAAGNNAPIREALGSEHPPQYVMLLNPDTEILPGAIKSLLDFLDANSHIGIAGSRLEWATGEGQRASRRFPSVAGELESTMRFGPVSRILSERIVTPVDPVSATSADWVVGASMMVRKEVFDAIGLLDEAYFLYFEEVDFCLRAKRAGWPTWYLPDSRVTHHVGHSSGVTSAVKQGRCPKYWFDSRRRYFLKNHGWLRLWAANLASILGLSFSTLRDWIERKPSPTHRLFLWDFMLHSITSTFSRKSG